VKPSDLFPPTSPQAASFGTSGLDAVRAFVEEELDAGTFPGASLVVIRDERTVFERAWGSYCDGETRDRPYSLETTNLFYSFSKPISATIVAMAVERGLIGWDNTVASHVPGFAQGGKADITIRQLLTHAAGIPSVELREAVTEEGWNTCVQACCEHELEWAPGSRSAYHALSGMLMAAECVRRAAGGGSWDEIAREWLFEPLGAETLSFAWPRPGAELALTPQPEELPTAFEPATYWAMGHPAGGCMGTLAEIHRFLWLHLNSGVAAGERLLQAKTVREMRRNQHAEAIEAARHADRQPDHEPWGLGWLLRNGFGAHWFGFGQHADPESFGHAGIDTVMTVVEPSARLTISFLTTASHPDPDDVNRLRNRVTDLVMEALA